LGTRIYSKIYWLKPESIYGMLLSTGKVVAKKGGGRRGARARADVEKRLDRNYGY